MLRKLVEQFVEYVVFASRWIQAPLYLGLIFGSLLYTYKFMLQLDDMFLHFYSVSEEDLMLGVLGLVDMSMVANLVYMVVVGGYTMFVSKIEFEEHPDRPEWLVGITANTLKIKLSSSLIGVSGIHLLKTFIELGHPRKGHEMILDNVKWQVLIHITFLFSSLALALTERMLHPRNSSEAAH